MDDSAQRGRTDGETGKTHKRTWGSWEEYIRQEVIPHYLALDIPLKEIKHSTLSDLSYYDEAHKIKDEMKDSWCWFMGAYVKEAFQVVMANAFAKKGAQPVTYRESPFLKEFHEQNRVLTEEEKQEQISILFGNLEIMQHNFEASHGEKKCPT